MFKFAGTLGRKWFCLASGLRIGLFLASVVAFPLFLMGLAAATGCRRVEGACGVVGVIGAAAFKPLAFAIFVFSFVGIAMRRARDAGVPGWIGLFVPLLFAADQAFFVVAGTPWSYAFVTGVLRLPVPRYALLALACTAVLCALPSRRDGAGARNPFGHAIWAAFGLGLLVAVYAIMMVAGGIPGAAPAVAMVFPLIWPLSTFVPYAMVALVALLVWIAWRERNHVAIEPARSAPEPGAALGLPIKTLVALALVLAIAAFYATSPDLIALALNLIPTILPTLLLYFCLLSAIFLVATRRTPKAVGLLVLAFLPFAHWAYAHWATTKEHEREAAEVAAIPTTPLGRVVATIMFDPLPSSGVRAAWTIPWIERAIFKDRFGTTLTQIDRPAQPGSRTASRAVDALPDEYLLLKIGHASSFAKRFKSYAKAGGPLELRTRGSTAR